MTDRIQQVADSPPGRFLASRLGLPNPAPLRRYEPGQPLLDGPAVVGHAPGGRLDVVVRAILVDAGADVLASVPDDEEVRLGAAVFDATGIASSEELRAAYAFFGPLIRRVGPSGRLLVLGTPPESAESPGARIAQRALEGFMRSMGKEARGGTTAQLVYVDPGAEGDVESTLRFVLSARSAYVSGQVVRVRAGDSAEPDDWERALAGKVALVTGASRGIGAAIAHVLARDGAHVICLDVPAQGEALAGVANAVGGEALQLDITAGSAPQTLVEHVRSRHDGVDVVVHNAGITRDKTLGRMDDARWDSVMAVNLVAPERLTLALLESGALREGGRVIAVSSTSGIAGNAGQTNYGASKAGVIGLVDAFAPVVAERPATINAVAPGFIETQMTAAMPVFTREAGRRLNSLSQGGLPVDVAETIAWLASPGSAGLNGNLVRVCGQSLIGA